ncbi:LamG domain-containing protein, partial [Patescibacteria group bacterium]|nr:LamG domain-containing protein [Patescibacteria group bacterium]
MQKYLNKKKAILLVAVLAVYAVIITPLLVINLQNKQELRGRAAISTTTPILFFPFNEGTGTVTADSSGNGNTGTLINGPVWTTGKIGSALQFNGVNNYVSTGNPSSLSFGTGNFTYSFWVYTISNQSNTHIISKWKWSNTPSTNQGIVFTVQQGPWLQVWLGDASSSNAIGSTSYSALPLNAWKHIALTRQSGIVKLFVDAVQVDSNSLAHDINTTTPLTIGGPSDLSSKFFNGKVDEIKIYNRALTDSEVLAEYQATTPTPTPISCPIDPSGKIIVNFSERIRSDKTQSEAESGPVAASIPAGNYKITLASYDDHVDKPGQTQPAESWYVKLKDASDTDVAISNAISDLPDTQDWLVEEVNSNLNVAQEIVSVLAFHAAFPDPNANSIDPICAAFETISPTPTPATTFLDLTIYQHGIGNSGDNTNPADTSLSNKNPVHKTINADIELFNTANQMIGQGHGPITYATGSGNFQGTIDIYPNTFPSGKYYLKVKTATHLKKLVPGILTIAAGQTNTVP